MQFRGRSHRSLDPKGRVMLPPEFRDVLLARCAEGRLVLTSYDDCIVGFPLPDWEEFEAGFEAIAVASRKVRDFRRLVVGGAEEVVLDNQGRVRLTPAHREYAGLEKDLALVGQLTKFEIWSPGRLDGVHQQNFDDVAEELERNGVKFPL